MSATATVAATTLELATYIHGEMTFNAVSATAAAIRRDLSKAWTYKDGVEKWVAQVNYKRPWDHKPYIVATYGKWAEDLTVSRRYPFDTWSNIHYGYVGRAVGFSAWTLRAGAGLAQWKAGSPDGYLKRRLETLGDADVFGALDHPEDQVAIMIGAILFDAKGGAVTVADILAAIRAVPDKLGAKPL